MELSLEQEAESLGRLLLGKPVPPLIAARYAAAVEKLGLSIPARETKLWRLALEQPFLFPFLDAGCGLLYPRSAFRKRVLTLLAVLETTPDFAGDFLPVSRPKPEALAALVTWAMIAAARSFFGAVLVGLLSLGVHEPSTEPKGQGT